MHALESLLAAKTGEVNTLTADVKLRGAIITAHEKEISQLREDFKDSQQMFEDAQEQLKIENRGAWAKVDDLDTAHKKVWLQYFGVAQSCLNWAIAFAKEHTIDRRGFRPEECTQKFARLFHCTRGRVEGNTKLV